MLHDRLSSLQKLLVNLGSTLEDQLSSLAPRLEDFLCKVKGFEVEVDRYEGGKRRAEEEAEILRGNEEVLIGNLKKLNDKERFRFLIEFLKS